MTSTPFNNALSASSPEDIPQPPESATAKKHSYGQILKSSLLIGGSSAVKFAIGIVRTKAMALLLGPAGFGLRGLYGSIADVAYSNAGMGVNASGVRQIAEAVGSGETERIGRTVAVLRRTSHTGESNSVIPEAMTATIQKPAFSSSQRRGKTWACVYDTKIRSLPCGAFTVCV